MRPLRENRRRRKYPLNISMILDNGSIILQASMIEFQELLTGLEDHQKILRAKEQLSIFLFQRKYLTPQNNLNHIHPDIYMSLKTATDLDSNLHTDQSMPWMSKPSQFQRERLPL